MSVNNKHGIALYTDGSCNHVSRSGGWAWVAVDAFDGHLSSSGYASDTTVNRMELTAVAEGLKQLYETLGPSDVLVHSDSKYVVLGCQYPGRKRNVNKDIWLLLDGAIHLHDHVEFTHVKGHRGDVYNEMADHLASRARKGKF